MAASSVSSCGLPSSTSSSILEKKYHKTTIAFSRLFFIYLSKTSIESFRFEDEDTGYQDKISFVYFPKINSPESFIAIFSLEKRKRLLFWRRFFVYFNIHVKMYRTLNWLYKPGADLGGGCRGFAPPPWDDLRWYSAKKKTMWFIGVEVEQETSALPPKKNPGSASASA